MPPEAQTRLLRVLQEGEYTTVGGRTPIRSRRPHRRRDAPRPAQLIRQGLFREDLFYRLNVVPMRLPPLRERAEDIPDLVRHFLSKAANEGLPPKISSTASAMERLKAYRWPGNVRELENLVRRLAALYSEEVIGLDVIEAELADACAVGAGAASRTVARRLGRAASAQLLFDAHGEALPPPGLYDRVLREVERPLIALTLEATRGNQIRAAAAAGPQPQHAAQEDPRTRHSRRPRRRPLKSGPNGRFVPQRDARLADASRPALRARAEMLVGLSVVAAAAILSSASSPWPCGRAPPASVPIRRPSSSSLYLDFGAAARSSARSSPSSWCASGRSGGAASPARGCTSASSSCSAWWR